MELTLKNFIHTYDGHVTKLNIYNSTTNKNIKIDSCIDDIRNNGLEDVEILDWNISDETIELIVTQEKSVVTDWVKVSDMLPVEDGVKVLATVKERSGSYVEMLYYIIKDSDDLAYHLYWEGAGFYQMNDCTFHKKDNVVAWRILPKPFVEN